MKIKKQKIRHSVLCGLLGLGIANLSWSDTLISNVKVTGLFNSFEDLFDPTEPYFDMYFQLATGWTTDVCPVGVHPYSPNLWRIAGSGDGSVNKAFLLLEAASIADMTVSVEGTATPTLDESSAPTGQCTGESVEYIILHNAQI